MNSRHLALIFLCLMGAVGGALYGLRAARFRQFSPPSADETFVAIDRKHRREEAALLPVGSLAPDFDLPTVGGGMVSLAQACRGCKAVLVNFGFIDCAHCRTELPVLVNLNHALQGKGLTTILIDVGDTDSALRQWRIHNHVGFPVATTGSGPGANNRVLQQYGVTAYPTTYLINADGKILWRGTEEIDETTLRIALVQADVL